MKNYCTLQHATMVFIPVTEDVELRAALRNGEKPGWVYAKAYMVPYISRCLKIFADKGSVLVKEEPVEFIFLSEEHYKKAVKEDPNELEECFEDYHFVVTQLHQKKKTNKTWVFCHPNVAEKLFEYFTQAKIPSYLHEFRIDLDRLYLIYLQGDPYGLDNVKPDTDLYFPLKIDKFVCLS